jgi:outer membrane beta-barrel protein
VVAPCAAIVMTMFASSTVAHAQPVAARATSAEPAPAKPSDAPLPSCLDQSLADQLGGELKPRGVQTNVFLKRRKLNLVMHGGLYAGDLTSSSWIAGGALGFFFTEDFGISAEFDLTPLTLDLDAPLAQFFNDSRFEPGMAYVGLGNLVWSPIHAKLKMGGGIVHSDFLLFAGGGRMFHDAVQGIAVDAGFALDMFVTKAMSIRLAARDLMAVQEVAAETRYTNNIVVTAGLSLWIPVGL